jgi:hypothetical protein
MANNSKIPLYPLFLHTRELVFNGAARLGLGVASYRQPARNGYLRRILEIKKRREMLLTPVEASQIFSLVRATSKLGGSMAEIGVFRGASARLIREADLDRPLHLFDTFEGLPETTGIDIAHRQGRLQPGQFACPLDEVKDYLTNFPNVFFHQGVFPSTAAAVDGEMFSFVHSDVDLYEGTLAVLNFFYPRMLPGGVIISHDFASCEGVPKAFMEFCDNLATPVIELPGDQAMIVRI